MARGTGDSRCLACLLTSTRFFEHHLRPCYNFHREFDLDRKDTFPKGWIEVIDHPNDDPISLGKVPTRYRSTTINIWYNVKKGTYYVENNERIYDERYCTKYLEKIRDAIVENWYTISGVSKISVGYRGEPNVRLLKDKNTVVFYGIVPITFFWIEKN